MQDTPLSHVKKFRWAHATGAENSRVLSSQAVLLIGLLLAVLLVAAGFWIHHETEEALHAKLHLGLETVLQTDVAALEFWLENEISNFSDWAEQSPIRTAAKQLVAQTEESGDHGNMLRNAPSLAELRVLLEPLISGDDYHGFALVSGDGIVLAAVEDTYLGQVLSKQGMALINRVLQGQIVVAMPHQTGQMLAGVKALLDAPRMAVLAPVRDAQQEPVAALALFIPPEKDFTRILSVARLGESGDTYAFDADGLMLSDSRHDDQLKVIGLIPDTEQARSILRVQLRDPGGDMTRSFRPNTPLTERPLTRPVAAALAGEVSEQVILTPYRDYRGVEVVGAWHWLEDYGFGVVTEVPTQTAFAAMRPIRWMVIGLLGLLLLSAALILVSTFVIQFLRRRVEQVRQLGQYTLESKIGEGGMGEVYLARHALLKRPTAVKLIRAEQVSEENLARFEREVQTSSQLTHPNTIEIYDYGRAEEGTFYYVMEYLPGLTLAHLMELEGAIQPARTIYIVRQLCASLSEAHGRGFVHRDIKPLNVILTERGGYFDYVKVLDFGLVRESHLLEADHDGIRHEVAGTPPYIAPERLQDPSCMDTGSDLFSVGVIAFNLVTGKQPFAGNSAMEIAWYCVNTSAPRPSEVTDQPIPAGLEHLIVACMARDPAQRPASADDIITWLDAVDLDQRWDQCAALGWWRENAARLEGAAHAVASSAGVVSARVDA